MTAEITLDELVEWFRSEHDPAQPPYPAARAAVAAAGDRLAPATRAELVHSGTRALARGSRYSLRVTRGHGWTVGGRPWADLPADDADALMAAGLVAIERARADLAVRTAAGTLTSDEYFRLHHDPGEGQVFVMLGWLPGSAVAIVAGIIAALITWNPWLFPLIGVGGAVLGWLATLGALTVLEAADLRWRVFGRHWGSAFAVVLLGTGPVVALLLAALLLWFA